MKTTQAEYLHVIDLLKKDKQFRDAIILFLKRYKYVQTCSSTTTSTTTVP